MINLLPIPKLIALLSATYAALFAIILPLSGNGVVTKNIMLSFKYATLWELLILLSLTVGWRKLWKLIPPLNDLIFPDLNGEWDVKINWQWKDKSGDKDGKAIVKQNFIKFSIEFLTDKSDSETLVVKPELHIKSGRPQIYYIYRNTPKRKSKDTPPSHLGAAILKYRKTHCSILEGNYFTDEDSKGTFKLSFAKD